LFSDTVSTAIAIKLVDIIHYIVGWGYVYFMTIYQLLRLCSIPNREPVAMTYVSHAPSLSSSHGCFHFLSAPTGGNDDGLDL
jgi:hypothetical protein